MIHIIEYMQTLIWSFSIHHNTVFVSAAIRVLGGTGNTPLFMYTGPPASADMLRCGFGGSGGGSSSSAIEEDTSPCCWCEDCAVSDSDELEW